MKLQGRHVLITGGSEGIGLALAKELVQQGADVTIVARTVKKLETAVTELQQLATKTAAGKPGARQSRVQFQAADVTVPEQILRAVDAAEASQGLVDVLIANAGAAHPGYFHEQDFSQFESSMRLNYLGAVAAVKAVYARMVARNSGHICLVASAMATMGFVGYSSYAPTKYALRGLADCLRNELQGTGVTVSVAFPPDTDTPGFQNENKSKPKETSEISALSEVFSPEKVARQLVSSLKAGRYTLSTPDIGLNLHATSTQGMVPRSFLGLWLAMLVGLIAPPIQAVYAKLMDRISRKHATKRFAGIWAPSKEEGGH